MDKYGDNPDAIVTRLDDRTGLVSYVNGCNDIYVVNYSDPQQGPNYEESNVRIENGTIHKVIQHITRLAQASPDGIPDVVVSRSEESAEQAPVPGPQGAPGPMGPPMTFDQMLDKDKAMIGSLIHDAVAAIEEAAAIVEPATEEDIRALEVELDAAAAVESKGFYGHKNGPAGFADSSVVVQVTSTGRPVIINVEGKRNALTMTTDNVNHGVGCVRVWMDLVDDGTWVPVKKFFLNNGCDLLMWPDGKWVVTEIDASLIENPRKFPFG